MRIAAKYQHTQRRIAFVCDVLPDQSLKAIRAERAKPGADDGVGTVAYDGPLSAGPDFCCPYCAGNSFVKCGACKRFSCFRQHDDKHVCPHCGQEGVPKPASVLSVEVGPERLGESQLILPGGARQGRIGQAGCNLGIHKPR